MKLSRLLFYVGIPAAGLLLALTACGSSQATGNAAAGTKQAAAPAAATINYEVVGHEDEDAQKGADGLTHDTFFTKDSTTISLGSQVTLKFSNVDEMPHSFTLPELGINVMIPAGSESKPGTAQYTFTATKAGNFRWFCALPCDDSAGGYAMKADPAGKGSAVDGLMAGYLTVK